MKIVCGNKLFALLRCALWGNTFGETLTAKQFQRMMMLAEEQTVAGLVFEVLKDCQIEELTDKKPIYKAVGRTEQIKQQNTAVDKELAWFVGKCDTTGLDCLVVKGQTMACLYPKAELRQSGDIDFLVTRDTRFSQVFPEAGIPERLSEKEFAFDHNGVTYELHTRLIDFGCKKHQKLWEERITHEWERIFFTDVNGTRVRTLSPTMNAAYLFVHLFFHLIREGVSLRQFCDWAMFLHAYRDKIDRQQLSDFAQQMDMLKGYQAFGCILVDELGLPKDEFPMPLSDNDRRWKEKILHDIFQGGNFGKQNHKAKSAFGFKMETLCLAIRNCIRYHALAPSEMRMMIPKMIRINIKLITK